MKYEEFYITLPTGEEAKVRYCDKWTEMQDSRVVHFEFLDCTTISHTGYKSEFHYVEKNEKVNPQELAKKLIEKMTGLKFDSKESIQQKLL